MRRRKRRMRMKSRVGAVVVVVVAAVVAGGWRVGGDDVHIVGELLGWAEEALDEEEWCRPSWRALGRIAEVVVVVVGEW